MNENVVEIRKVVRSGFLVRSQIHLRLCRLLMVAIAAAMGAEAPAQAESTGKPPGGERRYTFPDLQFHKSASDDRPKSLPDDARPFCVQADKENGFDIAFIEFDQRGDFWDRKQLAIARHQLKERTAGKKPLLIEYVHGWHNNSQEDAARDVAGFRKLLAYLAQSPFVQSQGYHVYGVYMGWRGEKYRSGSDLLGRALWLPSQLSFYSVKRTGTDVGTMPMLTEALFWMVHEARSCSSQARTVLIGHSFGAMVLENAISQAVASSAATVSGKSGTVTAPADLILLLNAASNSLRAKGTIEMLERMGGSSAPRFVNRDQPLVVSVTSTGDWATGKFYPLGTGLSNFAKEFRSYKKIGWSDAPPGTTQRDFVTQTPGHNKLLRSHIVTVDQQIAPSDPKAPISDQSRPIFERNLSAPLPRQGDRENRIWPFRSLAKDGTECRSFLRMDASAYMKTGYWVVEVPKEIIFDHGDIFNQQALCLYAALFRIDNPLKRSGPAGPRLLQMADPMINSPSPATTR